MCSKLLFLLGLLSPTLAVWQCMEDSECSALAGSVCVSGACVCDAGTQSVLGGSVCADIAPYHYSTCVENHQCSNLFTSYECRDSGDSSVCTCQPSHHYFLGRCWPSLEFGAPCTRDEECMGPLRDPFSLACNVTCGCADGYYLRQRGECRKIGYGVGDGCVLNEDCQFEGGLCSDTELRCYDSNNPETTLAPLKTPSVFSLTAMGARQHGAACSSDVTCAAPLTCSAWGACVCAPGRYNSADECVAELGSAATSEDECIGLFTEIRDGICTCLANFYFDENMRDCVKVARDLTDSCISDANCHTFGWGSRCGAPGQWQLRTCECDPELAVWDEDRRLCVLYAGIGEACQVDSDCLAGSLQIQCASGVCACPAGFVQDGALCLTTGLALGDACQSSVECTETPNTVCDSGTCQCDSSGYQELDGACAPIIGGLCTEDTDCVIEHTVCVDSDSFRSCQCGDEYVQYEDRCWDVISSNNTSCEVSAQCFSMLGENSACVDSACACAVGHHYRDGLCWPMTGLFEVCSRTSQCYLQDISDRVICRNSLCQCDFEYTYSEELNTCVSSARNIEASIFALLSSVLLLITRQ